MENTEFIEIGTGIYRPSDIEEIIRIPKRRALSWLKNLKSKIDENEIENKPIVYYKPEKYYYTNFLTMIELYIFNKLKDRNISNKKIYKAYKYLQKALNTKYPFADSRLSTFGREIIVQIDGLYSTTDETRQIIFEAASIYFEKLEFEENYLASRYYPIGKTRNIIVDPKIMFGQATIQGTRISASVIHDLLKAGESKEIISELYNIDKTTINDVIDYYDRRN